jgi:hypothetical protein
LRIIVKLNPEPPMRRVLAFLSMLCLALSMWAALIPSATAQSCASNAGCPNDQTCQPALFGPQCRNMPCNADLDCPFDRPFCFGGLCQAGCRSNAQCGGGLRCVGGNQFRLGVCSRRLPPSAPPSTPTGGTQAGEGQTCGRILIGGVEKSRGCRSGLQCTNGRCMRPLQ